MFFVYADPGLRDNLGHHANSCRHILGETFARGLGCAALADMQVQPSLRDELKVNPWFRCNTYTHYDRDPFCGWLTNFEFVSRTTQEDMARLRGIGPEDIVYLNSAQPAQFSALVQWGKSLPPEARPTVIIEFGTDPGVDLVETPERIHVRPHDPQVDPRAILHRYTARQLNDQDQQWLRLATYDAQSSSVFQFLLSFPVLTLPLPQRAVTGCRDRTGQRPITIGIMGHQRREKGYGMVPELVARLLSARNDVRFLVHNGWPEGLVEQQQALRNIAAADSRLILNEEAAGHELWSHLLDQSDLIVCPYQRGRFIASYSAVASEAISNAIPLVVPAGTTLNGVLREFGNPGTTFDQDTPDSVFQATMAALDDFDRLASLAKQASLQWDRTRGAARLVDTMISWRRQL